MKKDAGRTETDKLLEEMEKKIAKEYEQAAREMEEKLNKYMADFQRKNMNKLRALKNGDITQAEYKQWRTNQLLIGQRWTEMRDTLAQDMHNTNNIARSIVNGYMPQVYALNHNYGAYEVERASKVDTGYTLYSKETVERLMRDNPDMLPPPSKRVSQKIMAGKDIRWNKQTLRSVMTQSILQGESMTKIAKRLEGAVGASYTIDDIKNADKKTAEQISKELAKRNQYAAIRNARTMTTGAENAGRIDSYKRAKNLGIDMQEMWIATLDGRTRDSHRHMDGETVDVGELFSNGLRYPGDPEGPAEEVYNCRCTTVAQLKGFETDPKDLALRKNNKLGDMTYEEWKEGKCHTDTNKNLTPLQKSYMDEVERYNNIKNPTEADIKRVGKALRERMMEVYDGIEDMEPLEKEWKSLQATYTEMYTSDTEIHDLWNKYNNWRMSNGLDIGRGHGVDELKWEKLTEEILLDFNIKAPKELHNGLGHLINSLEKNGISVSKSDTVFDVMNKIADLQNKTGKEFTDKYTEYKALADKFKGRSSAEALRQELSLVRSMGITGDTDLSTHFIKGGMVKNALVNAYGFLPTDWIKSSINHGRIDTGTAKRGYYSHWRKKVVIHKPTNKDPDTVLDVSIHELTHRLERTADLIPTEKEFYDRRTAGETLEWLGVGYGKDEKTRKDKFVHKYMGKDYSGTAYELLSMGNEYAYTNPAKLMSDPDMMDWIYGILSVR